MSEIEIQVQGYGINEGYIAYDPEKFGCRVVAEYDTADSYEFDTVKVWQHIETGRVFAAQDSGCSCPTPFEDLIWPTDFVEVRTVADLDPLIAKVENEYDTPNPREREALKEATRNALIIARWGVPSTPPQGE